MLNNNNKFLHKRKQCICLFKQILNVLLDISIIFKVLGDLNWYYYNRKHQNVFNTTSSTISFVDHTNLICMYNNKIKNHNSKDFNSLITITLPLILNFKKFISKFIIDNFYSHTLFS